MKHISEALQHTIGFLGHSETYSQKGTTGILACILLFGCRHLFGSPVAPSTPGAPAPVAVGLYIIVWEATQGVSVV